MPTWRVLPSSALFIKQPFKPQRPSLKSFYCTFYMSAALLYFYKHAMSDGHCEIGAMQFQHLNIDEEIFILPPSTISYTPHLR